MPQVNYAKIPPHTLESLKLYLEHGVDPGDFLTAVLENNLKEAFGRADENNIEALFHLVAYLYNEVPMNAWGSRENMNNWIKAVKEFKAQKQTDQTQ